MTGEETVVTPAAENKVRRGGGRGSITSAARVRRRRLCACVWRPGGRPHGTKPPEEMQTSSFRFARSPLTATTHRHRSKHPQTPTQPTPVFGSASTFAGTGGFTGVASAAAAAAGDGDGAAAAAADDGEGAGGEGVAPEEECQAEFKPIVQLQEVETNTGEEDEDATLELKCKLYRFDAGGNEWKERGLGMVRLLRHKGEGGRTRLLMRQDRTLKIRANHIVMPGTKLQEHSGSDKAWVWSAVDFAEEEQRVELFCIRFGTPEKAAEFKKGVEAAAAANAAVLGVAAGAGAGSDDDDDEGEGEEEEGEAAGGAAGGNGGALAKPADAADALAGDLARATVADDGAAAAAPAAAAAATEAARAPAAAAAEEAA